MTNLRTLITSPPDRDALVVEVWLGDTHVGEIEPTAEGLVVHLYFDSRRDGPIALESLVDVLERAKKELSAGPPP